MQDSLEEGHPVEVFEEAVVGVGGTVAGAAQELSEA